jgi:hypothetical protein
MIAKRPAPSPEDVLRRMLNTPHKPHVEKKPKRRKKARK